MRPVFTILIATAGLLACALFSPRAHPTPPAIPEATLTAPAISAEAPTATPVVVPPVTLSAADFTPILYRDHFSRYNEFWVIGGIQEGTWLPAEVVAGEVKFEQAFDLYANGYAGMAVTKAAPESVCS